MGTVGKVYLVGAGPGDPELLTLKAVRAIQMADAVVYDRLVSEQILDFIPGGVARFDVGKRPNSHPVPQAEINELLISLARRNQTVVRLKGGDPFMFGRGGEELIELARRDIPVEVVPGITSAQGCAATAGVPLTHRDLASSVRYITGHCRSDKDLDFDWTGLADPGTTLVIYMGMANVKQIAKRLTENGLPGTTPVMAIKDGTRDGERRLISNLNDIAASVRATFHEGPVLFIVGNVVGLAATQETVNHVQTDVALEQPA